MNTTRIGAPWPAPPENIPLNGTSARLRVAILWSTYGHYHFARLEALSRMFSVFPVAYGASDASYRWNVGRGLGQITELCPDTWQAHSQFNLACRVWRVMDRIQPDVVLISGYSDLPAVSAAAWASLHRRISILMSDSTYSDRTRSLAKESVKRLLIKAFYSAAVCSGTRAEAYLQALGVSAANIGHKYDVVDNRFFCDGTDNIRRDLARQGGSSAQPYFLWVGRYCAEKNLEYLLSSYRTYRTRGGSWGLTLVGYGPLEGAVRKKVQELGLLCSVVIAGARGPEGLLEFYALAGCLVLPSAKDTWGLVVNEALASGLPVIVADKCGCADDLVLGRGTGIVIDPGEPLALTMALMRMESLSEEERGAMGKRGQSVIAEFSPEMWADEVLQVIRKTGNIKA